jgi:hypothetical protein
MATFSAVWQRWSDLGGGFHLTPWRVPDYLRSVQESGFVNVGYDILLDDAAALKAVLPRSNGRFRSIREQVLSILSLSLFGQKPL